MRVIETELYNFDELTPAAQTFAITKFRDREYYPDHDWYSFLYMEAKEIGKLMGITINHIHFSGFSSQGDGACFVGEYAYNKQSVKLVKAYAPNDTAIHSIAGRLAAIQRTHLYKLTASIKHSGHYYHEYCTNIDVINNNDYASEAVDKEVTEILREYMRWIYKALQSEFDYLMTDDAVRETITANEYEFEVTGKMYA